MSINNLLSYGSIFLALRTLFLLENQNDEDEDYYDEQQNQEDVSPSQKPVFLMIVWKIEILNEFKSRTSVFLKGEQRMGFLIKQFSDSPFGFSIIT